jgi:hypothetical protein
MEQYLLPCRARPAGTSMWPCSILLAAQFLYFWILGGILLWFLLWKQPQKFCVFIFKMTIMYYFRKSNLWFRSFNICKKYWQGSEQLLLMILYQICSEDWKYTSVSKLWRTYFQYITLLDFKQAEFYVIIHTQLVSQKNAISTENACEHEACICQNQ